jgi:putative ABC transport system ATP-binding protein
MMAISGLDPHAADRRPFAIQPFAFSHSDGGPLLTFPGIALAPGDILIVRGENGSGKTTLLNGLHRFRPFDPPKSRRDILLIDQNYDHLLFPYKPVWWNLVLPRILQNSTFDPGDLQALARESLRTFELEIDPDRMPGELSGGEKHLVVILRSLHARNSILLIDEPTAALDDRRQQQLWQVLARDASHHGRTVIAVSHTAPALPGAPQSGSFPGFDGKTINLMRYGHGRPE